MLNYIWMFMMAGGILTAAFRGSLGSVTQTLIDSSSEAVNLCIFMVGIISVWNGMMEIAVKSGLMRSLARLMHPFIHWLFPDIPPSDKANEYIAANMAANILGLGWAATPAGLKAMKELKRLQEESNAGGTELSGMKTVSGKEAAASASDMMCAFLVLNISSLQLIPINMIAYRSRYGSADPAAVVLPSICATAISTMAGIFFIKCMELVGRRRMKLAAQKKKKLVIPGKSELLHDSKIMRQRGKRGKDR